MKWFILAFILIVFLGATTYWVGNTLIEKASKEASQVLNIKYIMGASTSTSADIPGFGRMDVGLFKSMLPVVTSLQGSADANFNFKSHFVMEPERHLEKVNLSCVDEYRYLSMFRLNGTATPEYLKWKQIYQDENCVNYETVVQGVFTTALYKCPLHNCAMKEVQASQFIPERFDITHVAISASGAGTVGTDKVSLPFPGGK